MKVFFIFFAILCFYLASAKRESKRRQEVDDADMKDFSIDYHVSTPHYKPSKMYRRHPESETSSFIPPLMRRKKN